MNKHTLTAGGRSVLIYTPSIYDNCPIIYTHLTAEDAEAVIALLGDIYAVIVAIDGVDWNGDLSPWPSPKAFKGGEKFAGGGDAYLRELTESIVPAVEANVGFSPCYRVIAGYSMAGLFAIYALHRTDIFNRVASMSGSLWYDGLIEFMKKNQPLKLPERVYFSLGDCESKVRNQRLAKVEECTLEAEKLFQSFGVETVFEMNAGNHFMDIPERFAKGLSWIMNS